MLSNFAANIRCGCCWHHRPLDAPLGTVPRRQTQIQIGLPYRREAIAAQIGINAASNARSVSIQLIALLLSVGSRPTMAPVVRLASDGGRELSLMRSTILAKSASERVSRPANAPRKENDPSPLHMFERTITIAGDGEQALAILGCDDDADGLAHAARIAYPKRLRFLRQRQ